MRIVQRLTHAEQIPVKFSPVAGASSTVQQSEHIKTANAYIMRLAPGFSQGWHNADERRYVVTISGQADLPSGSTVVAFFCVDTRYKIALSCELQRTSDRRGLEVPTP